MSTRIPEMLNRPWAITADKFATMLEVYERHAAGAKFDVESLRAASGSRAQDGDVPAYTVQSGVAVIPIDGVLSKRMNLFSYFSGGTSTQVLTDTVQQAAADPTVHSLLLSIDSPGGEVDGTQVAAQAVAAVDKPVLAWLDGMCCSGAMWIASQADARYIADETTIVGSIGVVATHTDRSKANEQAGKKVTEVTAGKYKRIASSHAPLTPEGHDVMQGQVDQIYSVFVDDVSQGLGVSTDTVLSDMADGQLFIGQQAIDAGLAEGVASQDQLIAQLAANNQQRLQNPGTQLPAKTKTLKSGDTSMPFKTFENEADYNAAVQTAVNAALPAEFERGKAAATVTSAQVDAARAEGKNFGLEEGKVAGATAERERIAAIESTPLAAQYPEVIAGLKADGKSGKPEAAMAILAAEAKARGDKGAAIAKEAPAAAPASAGTSTADNAAANAAAAAKEQDPMALAAQIRTRQAKAKSEGRTLSAAQASAEIEAESKTK